MDWDEKTSANTAKKKIDWMAPNSPTPDIPKKNRLYAAAALAVVGSFLVTLIYIGVYSRSGLASFDIPVSQWIGSHQNPSIVTLMHFITNSMGPESLIVLTVLLGTLWAWHKKEYWQPGLILASLLVAFGISSLFKILIARPRPPIETMALPLETGFSFPSIHTVGITVAAFVLGYLLYTRQANLRRMLIWASISSVCIILVASSRLYLGYHWLTDVTASISLALIVLAIIIVIDSTVLHRFVHNIHSK